jgi:hypothetical protein
MNALSVRIYECTKCAYINVQIKNSKLQKKITTGEQP